MRCTAVLFTLLFTLSACGDPTPARLQEEIVEQAQTVGAEAGTTSDARTFARGLVGFWRIKNFEQGLWVDLIWVMGRHHAWHVVTVYADEALTVPLVRWDIVRGYELEGPSSEFPDAYNLQWTDRVGGLTPFVNDPALFASVGLDDCDLAVGTTTDLSLDNCGAPFFPFRDCPLMDFVQLRDDRMTFGDPRQGDRCTDRPTQYEAWTFERVPFTPQLREALFRR